MRLGMRKRRPLSISSSDRETQWHIPSRQARAFDYSRYIYMLAEDVRGRILPYGKLSRNKDNFIVLRDGTPQSEALVTELLGKGREHVDLEEAVEEFVRDCVASIIHERRAIYEHVTYAHEGEPHVAPTHCLEHVPQRSIWSVMGRQFQVIPRPETDFDGNTPPRVRLLSSEKIVIFDMPREYRNRYSVSWRMLRELGKDSFQKLYIHQLEGGRKFQDLGIDVQEGYRTSSLAVLSATSNIGWNARDYSFSNLQEYYGLIRFLRFEKFLIELREHILARLNDYMRQALPDFPLAARLEFQNLPLQADVAIAYENLSSGKMPFSDIIKPFLDSRQ